MNTTRYESHNLENKKLPIIFHFRSFRPIGINTSAPANWHNNVEILHFTTGRGRVMLGNEYYDVDEGDTIVVNSNILHSITSNKLIEYYCLIVDSDFCTSNGIDFSKFEFDPHISSAEIKNIFLTLVSEINSENKFRTAAIKAEVLRLMVYLARNYSSPAKKTALSPSNTNKSIKLAIGYIRIHINERLMLEQISNEVGLSKFYFTREFKKATGMTPVSYINALRCQNASKLLIKNEDSVHSIALKCGFENDSYFSKTFKKHTGFLPSEYIKKQNRIN